MSVALATGMWGRLRVVVLCAMSGCSAPESMDGGTEGDFCPVQRTETFDGGELVVCDPAFVAEPPPCVELSALTGSDGGCH
jgi:hypothetical protein